MYFADMHLEIFLADFAVFRGSATARIIRSPGVVMKEGLRNDLKYVCFFLGYIKEDNRFSWESSSLRRVNS